MDSLRWKYSKLNGNEHYEFLKNDVETLKKGELSPVKVCLLTNLELLVDDMILNEKPENHGKVLMKIRKWYEEHKVRETSVDEKRQATYEKIVACESPVINLRKRRIIEKTHQASSKNIRIKKNTFRNNLNYIKLKEKTEKKWGMAKSRSSEEITYNSELRKILLSGEKKDIKRDYSFFSTKLKKIYRKHKKITDSHNFSFKYEVPTKKNNFNNKMDEIQAVKDKFSKKKMYIPANIIDPDIVNITPSDTSFPRGGEGLLSLPKIPVKKPIKKSVR